MRTGRLRVGAVAVLAAAGITFAAAGFATVSGASARHTPSAGQPYGCAPGADFTISGTFGDAGLIGWLGDQDGVVTCLGGSFYVRDGKYTTLGYGVYDYTPTRWNDVAGYLPAQASSFTRDGTDVVITNFADKATMGGHPYVVVYSRVQVHNPTGRPVNIDPGPTPGLVPLNAVSDVVAPGATVNHDYAVAADRFGGTYAWPSDSALAAAGGFDQHFAHMAAFWNAQLSQIASLSLPDPTLVDAYKAGFIETQIIRDGNHLNTGENGYDAEFSHDVIGILTNLFTQGYFSDAHALLLRAGTVIGTETEYADGRWTYAWPWAIYLLKTGDLSFVRASFFSGQSPSAPSIMSTAHAVAADRTGPGGIMEKTGDIDADGYWTIDNYEALMGLAAYRYLAEQVGDGSEVKWAASEYQSLLASTDTTLRHTITSNHLTYLPCSMLEPNTANRCANPADANWAAPFLFGRWAWDGQLFGADVNGPGLRLIDATYDYGFARLAGRLPPNTFGGYPSDFWSTAYNAGYGEWGLASRNHRSQGISSYQWMIANDQSGPYSWWESSANPNPASPWVGVHPAGGQGSAPHAWGMANANKVLLDSLAAQASSGTLIIGRGVPGTWLTDHRSLAVGNFPTTGGGRISWRITSTGSRVTLTWRGHPGGTVDFEVPAFVDNVAHASTGTVNEPAGVVAVSPSAHSVTVTLRRPA
jgi:hypothetical protein